MIRLIRWSGWPQVVVCVLLLFCLPGCLNQVESIVVGSKEEVGEAAGKCGEAELIVVMEPIARFEPAFADCPDAGEGPCAHVLADEVWLSDRETVRANWNSVPATYFNCSDITDFKECDLCVPLDCEMPEGIDDDATIWPPVFVDTGVYLVQTTQAMTEAVLVNKTSLYDPIGPCLLGIIPEFTPTDGGYYLFKPHSRVINSLPELDGTSAATALAALDVEVVEGTGTFTRSLTLLDCPAPRDVVRYFWRVGLSQSEKHEWETNFSDTLQVTEVRVKQGQTYLAPERIVAHPEIDPHECFCANDRSCSDDIRCYADPEEPEPGPGVQDDGNIDFVSNCYESPIDRRDAEHTLTPTYYLGAERIPRVWIAEFAFPVCRAGDRQGEPCTDDDDCPRARCKDRFVPPDPGNGPLQIEFTLVTKQ